MDGAIVALDVGDSRIGVAACDPLRILASHVTTIERSSGSVFDKIGKILLERGATYLIIGLPLELSGELGPQGEKVVKFSEKLKAFFSRSTDLSKIAVVLWDERMTTAQAKRLSAGSGKRNRERSAELDQLSAQLILESYLSQYIKD